MRRLVTIGGIGLLVVLMVLVLRAVNGDDDPYKVRAVFDNGAFVVPDVDVRVAGANVGNVDSIDVSQPDEVVTDDPDDPYRPGKAIVVLNITDPAFRDFRDDASCIIRPQSLIGEKFLDCDVTQPRPSGSPPPPQLEEIPEGQPGAGQYLLPLENNGRSVDQDLINNIYRLPYAQRFRIILNELGVGLATRGPELRETITRANPTLLEVNRVLKILSSQNRRLAELARNGDNNLTLLAAKRRNMVGFFRSAGYTAGATAERSDDMRENLRNLPTTLRSLRETFGALKTFASDTRPTIEALQPNAKQIAEVTKKLQPFAEASQISFESLGAATRTAGPDLIASRPIIQKLGDQARSGKEPFTDLNFFLGSTRTADGFRNLMRFFYNTGSALSGYDQFGHYQRTNVIITGCTEYKLARFSNCPTQWDFTRSAVTSAAREVMPDLEIGLPEAGDLEAPQGPTDESEGALGPTDEAEDESGATGDSDSQGTLEGVSPSSPEPASTPDGQTVADRTTGGSAGSGSGVRGPRAARAATRMAIMEYLLGR